MGATAEERIAKRRINELESKLKKLQRELREIKNEKKHVKKLRKQVVRSAQVEADCKEVIEEATATELTDKIKQEDKSKHKYRCKNPECINAGGCYKLTGECDIIEAGTRLIIVCRDCGSRYTVSSSPST